MPKILTSIAFKAIKPSLKRLRASLVFEKTFKSKNASFGSNMQNQYLNFYYLRLPIKLAEIKRKTDITGAKTISATMTANKNSKKALF